MTPIIEGIIPVMLTPFTATGGIDYAGLENLIEWYLGHGADALFAVCQSSEMAHLTRAEREDMARFIVHQTARRVPVLVSGHVSDDPHGQFEDLMAAARSGADLVVLVTNHLDPGNQGREAFLGNLGWLLERLPADLPLGLYECPVPYRRLVSDEELTRCLATERFHFLKDVSCDLPTLQRRLTLTAGSPLTLVNANAAIAWPAMRAGVHGFCGVFTNIHPDLYQWLYRAGMRFPDLAGELANFLVLAASAEAYGYPVLAKRYHQRLGTFGSIHCRAIPGDPRERFWALDDIVHAIIDGTERMRGKLACLDSAIRR